MTFTYFMTKQKKSVLAADPSVWTSTHTKVKAMIDSAFGEVIASTIKVYNFENKYMLFGFKVDDNYNVELNEKLLEIIATHGQVRLETGTDEITFIKISEVEYLKYFPIESILIKKIYLKIDVRSKLIFTYYQIKTKISEIFNQKVASTMKVEFCNIEESLTDGYGCTIGIICNIDYVARCFRLLVGSRKTQCIKSSGVVYIVSDFTEAKYNAILTNTEFIIRPFSKKRCYNSIAGAEITDSHIAGAEITDSIIVGAEITDCNIAVLK